MTVTAPPAAADAGASLAGASLAGALAAGASLAGASLAGACEAGAAVPPPLEQAATRIASRVPRKRVRVMVCMRGGLHEGQRWTRRLWSAASGGGVCLDTPLYAPDHRAVSQRARLIRGCHALRSG